MNDSVMVMKVIGLILFITGYAVNEMEERQRKDEVNGLIICFIGGFLMAIGLFIDSS